MDINKTPREYYLESGLPAELKGWHMEKAMADATRGQIEVFRRMKRADLHARQKFIIVTGPNNTGKSVMLSSLVTLACQKGIAVKYMSENLMLDAGRVWTPEGYVREDFPVPVTWSLVYDEKFEAYRHAQSYGLLLWDELAVHDYANGFDERVISRFNGYMDRIMSSRTNVVFVTNFTLERLRERVGKRFWARIERRGYEVFTLTERILGRVLDEERYF